MEEYLYCRYLPGDIVIFEDDEDAEMLVLGVQKGEGNHPLSYILYDRYMKGLVEITTHHYKIVSRLFDYNNTVYCSYCPYSKKGFTNKSGCSSFCSYYTKTVNDFFYVGDIVYDKSRLATYNIQTLFLNVYKICNPDYSSNVSFSISDFTSSKENARDTFFDIYLETHCEILWNKVVNKEIKKEDLIYFLDTHNRVVKDINQIKLRRRVGFTSAIDDRCSGCMFNGDLDICCNCAEYKGRSVIMGKGVKFL